MASSGDTAAPSTAAPAVEQHPSTDTAAAPQHAARAPDTLVNADEIAATSDRMLAGLRARANPARAAHTAGYFPTSMTILGTGVPDIRRAVRSEAAALKRQPASVVLAVAEALIAANVHESRQAAYELLSRRKDVIAALGVRDVERLGRGADNWASVDAFATLVAGPAWRSGRVTDAAVRRWGRSKDRWWRRTALVATVALNLPSRGGGGDVPRTMMVCELLATDSDPMVAKALSWALRSVIRHDAASVADFLERHADELPSLAKREVRNKLETGLKNPGR